MKVLSLLVLATVGMMLEGAEAKGKPGKGKNWGNKKPKNFIMVIPDGFGATSELMARDYVHWKDNSTTTLPIDEMIIGQIRTRSSDSYVTDSSASASAYSCGIKTYNGGVAVDGQQVPYGTVLEAASLKGLKTGLVVTSRITHATPASYIAHTWFRDLESDIALQMIGHAHPLGRRVDILMGGGSCFFTPQNTTGSCRKDNVDGLALARGLGYNVFQDRKSFDSKPKLPYLGLFTPDHMSYEVDRDGNKEPSLKEMTIRALDDLYDATRKKKEGFFIMVEASRIDHAGHANDPVGHLHDILAFNEAMKAITEWIDEHDDSPTVMIGTADHECGGLTVGGDIPDDPSYWYAPSWFEGAKSSAGVLAKQFFKVNGTAAMKETYLREKVFAPYGILNPSAAEVQAALRQNTSSKLEVVVGQTLSSRLRVNWSTVGHTGADVTLYGYGPRADDFSGHRENTEVAGFVSEILDLDLDAVSKKLRANHTWIDQWVKKKPGAKFEKRSLALHHH